MKRTIKSEIPLMTDAELWEIINVKPIARPSVNNTLRKTINLLEIKCNDLLEPLPRLRKPLQQIDVSKK